MFNIAFNNQNIQELQKTTDAKNYFFNPKYREKFEQKLKEKPEIDLETIDEIKNNDDSDSVKDSDTIQYYNRKYAKGQIEDKNTIKGAFGKVRAMGGATQKDSDLIT